MQGSFVKKRGQRWTAFYYVPGLAGQRRQRSKGGFATKREAQAFLSSVLTSVQQGDYVEHSKLTVADYLTKRWLPLMKSSIRPSTWDSYQRVIDCHVIPYVGSTALQELSTDQIDHLYSQLMMTGRHDGKPGGLSPKTVRYVHSTLHKALKDAERKRLIVRNPAAVADPPKLRQSGDREMQTWTPDELRVFLAAMTPHRLYAAYLLAVSTGMRRGEVLGLRWRDISFDNRRLAVRQTITSVNYQLDFGTPKTKRGRRSVALDSVTVEALQAHQRRQLAERQLVEPDYQNLDLVFAKPDGTPIHPDFFSQTFDRTVARLDLTRIRFHDLRHTHATLGLSAGVPAKIMSDRLGHSTVAFTQDRYMHAIPQLEEETAEQMGLLIFGIPDSA